MVSSQLYKLQKKDMLKNKGKKAFLNGNQILTFQMNLI